jgi:hypothetical protein
MIAANQLQQEERQEQELESWGEKYNKESNAFFDARSIPR